MKNYALNASEAANFITEIHRNANGTLTIRFADGKVFKNVAYTTENLEKIIAQQESQAANGINNYRVFKNKKNSAEGKLLLTGLGLGGSMFGATFIPAVQQSLDQPNGWVIMVGAGVILAIGTIPRYAKLVRERRRVKELDKLSYRQEHLEDLRAYQQYPNALSGVAPRIANWIRSERDPFGILHIDQYDEEDLRRICGNIQTEKEYAFQYKKGKQKR